MSNPSAQSVAKHLFRGLAERQRATEFKSWLEKRREGSAPAPAPTDSAPEDLDALEAALAEG